MTLIKSMGMTIRGPQMEDSGFIYDSMINSYHKGSPQNKCVRMAMFKGHVRDLLDLNLGTLNTVVVCSLDDPNNIYGWAAADGDRLVYVYVSLLWRNKGLGTALLDLLEPKSYACWTFSFRNMAMHHRLEFVPLEIKPINQSKNKT